MVPMVPMVPTMPPVKKTRQARQDKTRQDKTRLDDRRPDRKISEGGGMGAWAGGFCRARGEKNGNAGNAGSSKGAAMEEQWKVNGKPLEASAVPSPTGIGSFRPSESESQR
jgi:hypothetical protein